MISELLKQAIRLSRSGNKQEARQILRQILVDEPSNETAWLWFVDSMPTDHERVIALEGLLRINPESRVARIGLTEYHRREEIQNTANTHLPVGGKPLDGEAESNVDVANFADQVEEELEEPTKYIIGSANFSRKKKVSFTQPDPIDKNLTPDKKKTTSIIGLRVFRFFFFTILIIGMLAIIGSYLASAGWAKRYPILQIFISETTFTCKCIDADAYMVRVKDRIQRWKINQALYELADSQGQKPENVDSARILFDEENLESPPTCMKTAHDLAMMLFEYHLNYAQQLMDGASASAAYYKQYVLEYKSQLGDEFDRLTKEYQCDL